MDHTELIKRVSYDPETGLFSRICSTGNRKAGTKIGSKSAKGYMKAMVLGEYVKLHRLAWFYVHGEWPEGQIDHINGVKDDNRMANLRAVDTSTNCSNQLGPRKNNRIGYQGVHKIAKTGRFRAKCNIRCIRYDLGVFATAQEAHLAYKFFKGNNI